MLEKTYRPQSFEKTLYTLWETSGAFACGQKPNAQPYCIVIPPPNVTGTLHMGHALNNTLQDVLVRFERMRGRDVLWQPGTDHAGIATQALVERQLQKKHISRKDLGREAFLEHVWRWKEESGNLITEQLRRLGCSCDWSRERFTLDEGLSKAVTETFVTLYEDGLLYRDKRLVNWDPLLKTAVSDLEVISVETEGTMWTIRYPFADAQETFIPVATTRPETMFGDAALAIHPDNPRYKQFIGREVIIPGTDRRIPIIADTHADPEMGTGVVKISPGHDFNDFEVAKRHNLPLITIFDEEAHLISPAPEAFCGMERFAARKAFLSYLEDNGLLEAATPHQYTLPTGDRSGVVVEPRVSDQWFVAAERLAPPAIHAVEQGQTKFFPQAWEKTYFGWMRDIKPWCVSRQLWWGHRIPAWYGPDHTVFVARTPDEAQQKAQAHYGKHTPLTQDEDVLDTWFSSALWAFSTLGWPEKTPELARYYKTDVLVTGFDIIFFWIARMMMMGLHFMKEVPFHTVYVHALVRDAQGQKMSKSRNNIIDPLELIDTYGADALRFTLCAMAAPGRDVRLSETRVKGYRNFATKLWNATRLCQMNHCLPCRETPPPPQNTLNRWIRTQATQCRTDVTHALENYRFDEAAQILYHFIWHVFCDWYLELAKPLLRAKDHETQATTGFVLERSLRLLHPFMPFVTEALWPHVTQQQDGTLIHAPWPELEEQDTDATAQMNRVIELISAIRSVRAQMRIPAAHPLTLLTTQDTPFLEPHKEALVRLAHLDTIGTTPNPPSEAAQILVDNTTFFVPLAGVVDLTAERARLQKELHKTLLEAEKLNTTLNDNAFLSRAPAHVVEERQRHLAQIKEKHAQLQQALNRLPLESLP